MSNAPTDVLHEIYDNGRLPDRFYCDKNPMKESLTKSNGKDGSTVSYK